MKFFYVFQQAALVMSLTQTDNQHQGYLQQENLGAGMPFLIRITARKIYEVL